MKILVVDDAGVARKIVARMVTSLGFEVMTAADGQQALDLIDHADPPAAIITDWNMPVMDGRELAKAVRGDHEIAHLPILMVSSEADPRRVTKALLAGVDEYLFKPIDEEMIRERLELMGVYNASLA